MSQSLPVLYAHVSELARIEALVLDSVRSAESRRAYRRALDEFYNWCITGVQHVVQQAIQRVIQRAIQQVVQPLIKRPCSSFVRNLRPADCRRRR